MHEKDFVQLQSITFLGQTEEYWNLELFAIYPKHDTEIYFEHT